MNETQIENLARHGAYLGQRLRGKVEETHISWVILTTHFAFKIKKPLKLSFLDFSSVAARRKYCGREVTLNRRYSTIYLGVVPVKRKEGRWRMGRGEGQTVDYAVVMKRMRSSKRMDFMLGSHRVKALHIRTLARLIASFHLEAEVSMKKFAMTSSRKRFNDIAGCKPFLSRNLPSKYSSIVSRAIRWSDAFLQRHSRRFRERVSGGFKRDVHGDLHSGNIFLYRHPVLFDCIEFNDEFRQIDVLNEIAFFCMDLEAFGQAGLSRLFVKEYGRLFPCFQQAEDHRIFLYYKCYRANVRAKVHVLAAAQEEDPVKINTHVRAARKYLALMENYMNAMADL